MHGDVTFGIRPFGRRLIGGQKCITVIERRAIIIALFTNASEYSSKTTIICRYKHTDLSMQVLLTLGAHAPEGYGSCLAL